MSEKTRTRVARAEMAARSLVFDVMLGIILLSSAFAGIAAVVEPVSQLRQAGGMTAIDLTESAQDEALEAITGVPDGVWLQFTENGNPIELHADALDWPVRLLSGLGSSLLFGCLAAAGVLFYRVVREMRAGSPFVPGNPRRLRFIGLLLLFGGVGGQIIESLAKIRFLEATGAANGTGPALSSFTLNLGWIFAAAICFILAEAFARGRDLSEDVEGLV